MLFMAVSGFTKDIIVAHKVQITATIRKILEVSPV
jgi:hypothetical protein